MDSPALDELLDVASRRQLTPEELDDLADLSAGDVGRTLGRLMTGGPTALLNLRYAAKLRALQTRAVDDLGAVKEADRKSVTTATSGFWVAFSSHAVERYVERMNLGHVGFDEATAMLLEEAKTATHLRATTPGGEEQWLCQSGAVLVVRRDGAGRPGFCTTILDQPKRMLPEGEGQVCTRKFRKRRRS